MKNIRFVIPFYFASAPNSSIMIEAEIRFVKNPNHKNFGRCRIYLDSQYNPINETEAYRGYVTELEAREVLLKSRAIEVKDDFDQYDANDLREIKHLLSHEWIEGFNQRQYAD